MRSHPDVNCTSDSRRRGREGRLYLVGAVAVDGQATAGKMPIAIETLLEPRRALKVERVRIGCSAVN